MSEHHQEGLALLLYGIKQGGGFVALTGEVGTGKTTLCHCLLEQLPENVNIALVLNPKLNTLELLATICDELQIEYDEEKQSLKHLIDRLNKHLLAAHANNRKTILMIDEAQNLSLDVLEQIRLLTNLETSKSKLLQIILVGQPELKHLLEKPELRQLNQRITARYHLPPLSYAETQTYISHRLTISGGQASLFNRAAVKKVYQLSKGIPRLINVICDRALLGAYADDQKTVTAKTVVQAAHENFYPSYSPITPFIKKVLTSVSILALLLIAVFFISKENNLKDSVYLLPFNNKIVQEQKQPLTSQAQNKHVNLPAGPIKTNKIIPSNEVKQTKPKDFKSVINQHNISFDIARPQLIRNFDKRLLNISNCNQLKKLGIECLFEQSNWENMIALDRPVMMEFSLSATKHVYALLVGLKGNDPVFQFDNEELSFPLKQVLAAWDGYYLLLWQPPSKNIKLIYPQQRSTAVLWLRKQLSVYMKTLTRSKQADHFDDELKMEVMKFQKRHKLSVDGIVGFRTFIQLQNKDSQNNYTMLRKNY
ncbi:ExeA family protein [Methyloprofundus sedimenti]|nr:ExeA family protein [Methyloprofundus sedimenti]